jgi:hypothetical protein
MFAAVSANGFSSAAKNFQLNPSPSFASTYTTGWYWDYRVMTFYKGWIYSLWQDNSNSTGDNPDGTNTQHDIYLSRFPF